MNITKPITKTITKNKILYFIYLFFVIVGIILCGYILYKYISVFYTNAGHEGYQTNTTEYIKFATSTINTKNYLTPYLILNDKPYLICTIIDIPNNPYKNSAQNDFNKKNINYIVDFGIAIIQTDGNYQYAFSIENTTYNNKINDYTKNGSNALAIKSTYYDRSLRALPLKYYASLSYGFTLDNFPSADRSDFLSRYIKETRKYYDKNFKLLWLTGVSDFKIHMNYNNSTQYVSYILFKNTYLTTNSPNTFYWNDSNTGGYTHSVWYDNEKGYIFANITNNNNYNILTESTQPNANIFKNYKVNDNFNKYMSLEFYQDLPKLNYTTENKLYNIKINEQLYLKMDNITNKIITTNTKTDSTRFIIYSNTANNITTYKYVIPAAQNNLSSDYIIGFDYINAGTFTDNKNTPILHAYKVNGAIPIEFTHDEVRNLNNDDKLHNYKLPWFEFIEGAKVSTVLRGYGLFNIYLILDMLNNFIILSNNSSTNNTYPNIVFNREEFIIPTTTTTTISETTTTTIPETTTTTIPETTTTTPETTTTIPETTTTTTIPETTTTTTIPETTTTTTIPETTTTTTIPETTTTTTIPEVTTSSYYSSDTLPPILPRATIFLPRV